MKKPLISVIVPVYNVEKYLEICLDSILCQTYHNIEIILVNDGSTDNSRAICEKYVEKDNRVRLINQKNKGLSGARNTGINHANGDYIAFVDSDDKILNNMYEVLFNNIKKTNADISICDFMKVKDLTLKQNVDLTENLVLQIYNTDEIVSKFLRVNSTEQFFSVWNRLYRAELFDNIEFTEGIINEDVDFSYKIFLKSKFICVSNEKLYCYNIGNNSITRNKLSPKDLDLFTSWNNVLEYAKSNDKKNIQNVLTNCARARFTLLTKYAMYGYKDFDDFKKVRNEMINYIRHNLKSLLKCHGLDLKRKIAIVLSAININIVRILFKYKIIKVQL